MTQEGDGLHADTLERPGPPPELREPPRRSRALGAFVATFALAAFAGVVWYAYDRGLQAGSEATAPLIQADPSPIKVRPDRPGGLEVPNRDKLVFDAMRPGGPEAETVERLLPLPEVPAAPPAPLDIESETGAGTSGSAPAGVPPARQSDAETASQTAAAAPAPVAPPPAPAPAPAPAPESTAQASAPQAPAPAPAPQPAAETAAAAPAPAAPAPAEQTAALPAGQFRVQLGAVRDPAAAEREWTRLQRRYADLLSGLTLRVQRVDLGGDKGVFHRIQGGMLTEAAASQLCDQLKTRNQPCLLVRP